MKRIILLLAIAATAAAQDSDWNKLNRTGGYLNGRWWISLKGDESMKLGIVMGIADGARHAASSLSKNSAAQKEVWDLYRAVDPEDMTYSEEVTALDNFFADPLNRTITIGVGLVVINLQHSGYDNAKWILELRKQAVGRADAPAVTTLQGDRQ